MLDRHLGACNMATALNSQSQIVQTKADLSVWDLGVLLLASRAHI